MNIIISGGGTGGHIFPAISIANALRKRIPGCNILFVGAEGRMEMDRVPDAGYPIIGLPVAGFDRKHLWKNFSVILKLWKSIAKAKRVIADFRPDLVIGVGGYASGPVLKVAQKKGIPTLIQEQNSFAGVTNKMLAAKAGAICVAYHGMERFFNNSHIYLTGNPIRKKIVCCDHSREQAKKELGFPADKPLVAIVGGSLGALTLNESVADNLDLFSRHGVSVLWQTGKGFYSKARELTQDKKNIESTQFINRMDLVYRAADIFVSRAGASTISELQQTGTPAVLVPSPNVAEDHQRHNAEALATRGAAIMILDADCREKFGKTVIDLLGDKEKLQSISENLKQMGLECADADEKIVDHALELVKKN